MFGWHLVVGVWNLLYLVAYETAIFQGPKNIFEGLTFEEKSIECCRKSELRLIQAPNDEKS